MRLLASESSSASCDHGLLLKRLEFTGAGRRNRTPTTTPAVARFSGVQRRLKSERLQVSHHPVGPCHKESQGEFGPVQMRLWASDQARYPNHHAKECEH